MSAVVQFSDNRLLRIHEAKSLADAQKMGWCDTLKDMLHGWVKWHAIADAYKELKENNVVAYKRSSALALVDGHLASFLRLRLAFREKYASECNVDIDYSPGGDVWGYTITLPKAFSGTSITRQGLPIGDGQTLAAFQDMVWMCKLAKQFPIFQKGASSLIPMLMEKLAENNARYGARDGEVLGVSSRLEKFRIIQKHIGDFAPGMQTDDVEVRFLAEHEQSERNSQGADRVKAMTEPPQSLAATNPRLNLMIGADFELDTVPVVSLDDLASRWADKISQCFATATQASTECGVDPYVDAMIVNDESRKEFLERYIYDQRFNRDALAGFGKPFEDRHGHAVFNAIFHAVPDGGGKPERIGLAFSIQPTPRGEFRAGNLCAALEEHDYSSLGDLLNQLGGTKYDARLQNAFPRAVESVKKDIDLLMRDLGRGVYPLNFKKKALETRMEHDAAIEAAKYRLLGKIAHALVSRLEPLEIAASIAGVKTRLGDLRWDWNLFADKDSANVKLREAAVRSIVEARAALRSISANDVASTGFLSGSRLFPVQVIANRA